jgi:hypothetical protein
MTLERLEMRASVHIHTTLDENRQKSIREYRFACFQPAIKRTASKGSPKPYFCPLVRGLDLFSSTGGDGC